MEKQETIKISKTTTIAIGVFVIALIIGFFAGRISIGLTGRASLSADQVLAEITPKGIPDYGLEAGISYDNVETSLITLVGYDQSIQLNLEQQKRYMTIAITLDTACEYCCGIGNKGFGTADGRIACGCSHNIAFSGLTKWLIKNSKYTNAQIVQEIQKWKILFFPKDAVKEEIQKKGISPESVGLPSMIGGC